MDSSPLINNETPEESTYEYFEIKQGEKSYLLNIKYNDNNLILSLSEENLFLEVFQAKFSLNEIKLLNKLYSNYRSCKEFLIHIKIQIKNKTISINKTNDYIININLNKSVSFELKKQQISFDLMAINIYKVMSKLKYNLKNLENNYEYILKENKNIKQDIKKLNEENKTIKEKNTILSNDNRQLKESILILPKNEISKEDFANVKRDVNRILTENKELKNEIKKDNKAIKEMKEIIDNKITNEINKIAEQNKKIKSDFAYLKQKQKENMKIEMGIEGVKKNINKNNHSISIKTDNNFNNKVNNKKLNNNTGRNSRENIRIKHYKSFHNLIPNRNNYSFDNYNDLKNNNTIENLNLSLARNQSFKPNNRNYKNNPKEKKDLQNNNRPMSANQNKYNNNFLHNQNNIIKPINIFGNNKEKNLLSIFNISNKSDINKDSKNYFNQNNRYKINQNADKNNIHILNQKQFSMKKEPSIIKLNHKIWKY